MKCYFPIPNQHRTIQMDPKVANKQQTHLVQHLMQQNESLRRQLSTLMQPKGPRESLHPNTNKETTIQPPKLINNEEQVQQIYKSKMQKLKSPKSSKKTSSHIDTAPSSPKKADTNRVLPSHVGHLGGFSQRQQSNLKVIIVQKDSNGKFYRDRQSEQKIKNQAANTPHNLSFYKPNNNMETRPSAKQFPNKQNCTNNSLSQQKQEIVSMQRKPIARDSSKNVPKFCINKTNEDFYSYVIEKSTQRIQLTSPKTKKFVRSEKVNPIKFSQGTQLALKQQTFQPKMLSPRAAAYIEENQAQNKAGSKESTDEDNQKQLESTLSIERGMNEQKTKRRLRYDIYLNDPS